MTRDPPPPKRHLVDLGDAGLETFSTGRPAADGPVVCAAHPADAFGPDTARLLAATSGVEAVCINPRGLGGSTGGGPCSLERMVDDLELARQRLELSPWVFWGMSGGGWLALLYAHRHPDGLGGIMVESACACFRNRLADPACVLSPAFAAWKQPLAAAGLFDAHAHDVVGDPADTVWVDVDGVGLVFARRNGPALLVSPQPQSRAMMDAMPALWSFDARPWIDRVRISALVMAGTADPVVPLDHARAMHEGLPRSRFVAIDGAGHVPTAEQQPRAAEAVQDFMATLA